MRFNWDIRSNSRMPLETPVCRRCESVKSEAFRYLLEQLNPTVWYTWWVIILPMKTDDLILAAMTPGGGHRYTPVQIQKLLFLIERQIPDQVGGPHFHFEPYHYGPFDRGVYHQLDLLAARSLVTIDQSFSPRTFALTADGTACGSAALGTLPASTRDFIVRTSSFVRTQTFSSLVSAIYKAFPDMRENSVFQI